jgi:KOW motif
MRVHKYYKTDRGQRLGHGRHALKASREAIHVTKGDTVRVMRGDDKGKEGKVIMVYPKTGRIKVEGVNIVKKHRKARTAEEQDHRDAGSVPRLERDVAGFQDWQADAREGAHRQRRHQGAGRRQERRSHPPRTLTPGA